MKTVKVYGSLKKYLGQGVFSFDVATPAEAIQALCVNFKGLDQFLLNSEKDGVAYKVKVGKEKIEKDNIKDLTLPWTYKDVFSIRPVIQGAGRGFGRFLTGALILGVGFLVPASWSIGTFGITGNVFVGATLKKFGALMMISGAAEMLSPQPTIPPEANLLESFSISGLSNVNTVGTPIPIAYGRVYVGSTIVSTGLDTDEVTI